MKEIEVFYELKNSVLEYYHKRYPYFKGNWKNFSSQDISNLIEAIFEVTKNSVSEKWIYTHLKPESNEKLPRKDMLDILSQFVGKSGWDEYKHQYFDEDVEKKADKKESKNRKYWLIGIVLAVFLLVLFWKFTITSNTTKTIQLKEKYSNDNVDEVSTKVFVIKDSLQTEVPIKNSKIEVEYDAKVIVKNPLYKDKTLDLEEQPLTEKVDLEPNDYASILQGFIKSDIKDWQTRKTQLNKILHDNIEVIVMLNNNLGAEYFNKEEFSQKLIVPSLSLKKMQIVEVKNEANNQIIFIRLIQK